MVGRIKIGLAHYNRTPLKVICIATVALMLIAAVLLSVFNVFAESKDFSLQLSWQGNDNADAYTYDSAIDETRIARLRVSYRNNTPAQGYAPGELVITLNGLGNALHAGKATPIAIAADKASEGTNNYDWSYTYSSANDTYTFTNNAPIAANNSFDGMFEVIWRLDSRNTANNYSTGLTAKLRTAYNEQVTSNEVTYSQTRIRDEYTVIHSAKALSSPEGLTSALPAGTTADDYTWVNYTVNGSDKYNSLDVNGSERFDLWFLPECIVQSPSYAITPTGRTAVMDDGKTYECYSFTKNIYPNTSNPYLNNIYVAYPNNLYKDAAVNSYVEIKGTYYEEDTEETLASHQLTTNLADFGYKPIPGNIYSTRKQSYGIFSTFVRSHCSDCYYYGAVNSEHLAGGHEYSSSFYVLLNYREDEAEYYDLEFTDDFIDVECKDGTRRQLNDSEYNFTKIDVVGTNSLRNINSVPLAADTYPVEVYVRYAGEIAFETSPYMTTVLRADGQMIDLTSSGKQVVAVRLVAKGIKESIQWSTIASVYYEFHTTATDIRTDSGMVYNNMYFKLYNENGWANTAYDHNPETYEYDREYQRDLNTYGHTFDREYDKIHILEIPNDFRVTNNIENTSQDKHFFYYDGNITTNFNYLADTKISGFSQYTIIPEGMYIAENMSVDRVLLDNLTFSSDVLSDSFIRDNCTIERIEDYNGSGRTYLALHYNFSDSPVAPKYVTVSNIPMYSKMEDMDDLSRAFTMYAATLVDAAGGRWFSNYTDNNSMESGLWVDIDGDGNTTENASFYNSGVEVYKPLAAQLAATKQVSTSSEPAYSSPTKEAGAYTDSEIPTEYRENTYTYSLSLTNSSNRATHIVFADVLENEALGEWQGRFQSVNYTTASRRIGSVPKVWYSDQVENISTEPNFSTGHWQNTIPTGGVKSVAVEFETGELKEAKTATVYITMKAPEDPTGEFLYKLTENKCKAFYTPIDAGSGTQLDRTFLTSNDVPVKLVPLMGTIRLNKIDAVDGRYVAGVRFSLYEMLGDTPDMDSDKLIGLNYVTNSSGTIKTEKLLYGEYYFVETSAPLGYLLPENEADRIFPVTLDSDEADYTASITVQNNRKPGQFTLLKVNDRDEEIKVQGAKFSVFSADGTLVQDGNDPAYGLVTDANGEMIVQGIDWGDYYLLEIEAPAGYELYSGKIEFTVAAENDSGHTLSMKIADPQKPASAVLTKYEVVNPGDEPTAVTLDGAVYELHSVKDDKLLGTYMTDDDGKIHASDLTFGDYYFVETIPAQGYDKYLGKIPFTVNAAHTEAECSIVTTDTRLKGFVWLQKVDDEGIPVKGAVFEFRYREDDSVYGTYTTNVEGIIEISDLLWNDYYFIEIEAPLGYELDTTEYDVVINRQTVNDMVIITATNIRGTGSVKLTKVSETDETLILTGAQFSLYKNDGTLVAENLTIGDDGTLTVTDLAWGSYYFKETKAPAGYGLNPNSIRFSVNYLTAGKTQEITVTDPEETLQLEVTKKITTEDIVFAHGDPTFTFRLTGTDINGDDRTMYKSVTFDYDYYKAHENDQYLEKTVTFTDLLAGTYSVCEMNTNRYEMNEITDISSSGTLSADEKSVTFNLVDNSDGSATFVNDKEYQELMSHTGQVTNVVASSRKLTSIVAVWNGGVVTGEALDRTQLDVYAVYDDGEQEKLADDDYTLDNETFDSTMNGSYTITATYTEGGITRHDSFVLELNVAVLFTWKVTSTEPYTYDGKTYDGTVSITGYTGTSSVVRFPTEVTGIRTTTGNDEAITGIYYWYIDNGKTYRVTGVEGNSQDRVTVDDNGDLAIMFVQCLSGFSLKSPVSDGNGGWVRNGDGSYLVRDIKQIILPDGLKEVGWYAFYMCSGITGNLVIPDTVTKIAYGAFEGCAGFTGSLVIPDSVTTIADYAFKQCSGFNGSLIIGNGVTTINYGAFDACVGLTGGLTIGNSVTKIGSLAFNSCRGLTGSLVIPDSVTSLGTYAFYNCSGFTSLVIPDSITIIDANTFYNCTGFTGNLVIPDSITRVGMSAFNGCTGFTGNLVIPDSVTTIGVGAFRECSGFTGLVIPDSVTYIGNTAFRDCSGFTGSLVIPDSVTLIGEFAFLSCSGFTGDLVIPDSVTTLGKSAFQACTGFNGSLTIGSGITTIEQQTFEACIGFPGSLVIPDSVTSIGKQAFYYCRGFEGSLTIGSGVTSIGDNAFNSCSGFTGSLVIPDNVTTIGQYAFKECKGFNGSLTISNSVTTIEMNTFDQCRGFTGSLIIPDSVTSIGESAFTGCVGFNGSLTIGNGVTTIDKQAFFNCDKFTGSLVIPDNVTSIGDYAFSGCWAFNGSLVIPDSITTIGKGVFSGCYAITGSLVIPDSVTSIGEMAFQQCCFTGSLVIPDSVTSIGRSAFNQCFGFTGSLVIPDSVTEIEPFAFYKCTGIDGSITIGSGVTTIDQGTFEEMTSVSGTITVPTSVTSINSSAFKNTGTATSTLKLPSAFSTDINVPYGFRGTHVFY